MKKPAAVIALLSATVLLMGCSISSTSTEEETESAPELTETCEEFTDRGAVAEDTLVQMEDGRVFCSVKLNPSKQLAQPERAPEDYLIEQHGLTQKQIDSATRRGATFLIDAFFDNPYAGSQSSDVGAEWIKENSELYGESTVEKIFAEIDPDLTNSRGEYIGNSYDFLVLAGQALPPLKDNDGGARIHKMELTPEIYLAYVESEETMDDPSTVWLHTKWRASVTYRIEADAYQEWRQGVGSKYYERDDAEAPTDFSSVDLSGDQPVYLTIKSGHNDSTALTTQVRFSDLLNGDADASPMIFNLAIDANALAHN